LLLPAVSPLRQTCFDPVLKQRNLVGFQGVTKERHPRRLSPRTRRTNSLADTSPETNTGPFLLPAIVPS
jgi:hypothetical protein